MPILDKEQRARLLDKSASPKESSPLPMQHSQANSTLNPARLPDHVTEDCIDYGLGFKHRGSNSSTHHQITSFAAQPRPHSNNNNHIDLYFSGSVPKRGKSRPQTANLLHRKNNSKARIHSCRPSAMTRVNSTSVAGHSINPRNTLAQRWKKEKNTTLCEQSLAGFTAQLLSEALNDEN